MYFYYPMNPNSRAPEWHSIPFKEFEAYIHADRLTTISSPGAHYHRGFELLYFMEGENHIKIGGQIYIARAGDLAVYHPGVIHEEYFQPGGLRLICLRFKPDTVSVPLPNEDLLPPVIHIPHKEQFQRLFEQIVDENTRRDRWSRFLIGTYMTQFTVLVWRALAELRSDLNDPSSAATARINQIIEVINAGLRNDLSLNELASKAFLSESRFSHVFKNVVGLAPKKEKSNRQCRCFREAMIQ